MSVWKVTDAKFDCVFESTAALARGGRRLTTLLAADISTESARFQRINSAVDDVTDAAYNGIRFYDRRRVDVLIQSLRGAANHRLIRQAAGRRVNAFVKTRRRTSPIDRHEN